MNPSFRRYGPKKLRCYTSDDDLFRIRQPNI